MCTLIISATWKMRGHQPSSRKDGIKFLLDNSIEDATRGRFVSYVHDQLPHNFATSFPHGRARYS